MKPTLLIAERDAELCSMYVRFLSDRGYDVETASDGLDCLTKLQRVTPAAIVLDRELLWGGGDGVLARLREESEASGLPVILTATAGANSDGPEDIGPPVVKFLPKPFALTALLESVRAAIADSRSEAPFDGKRQGGPDSCTRLELVIG